MFIGWAQVSKQLVRERMQRENPEDITLLDSVKDSDIVCVKGTYDHIHLVLEAIGIPFSHVSPHTLLKMDLKPEQTVYVNCPSSFPEEVAIKLRAFVEEGGQLITTDWALQHVLEKAFPGTVRYSGTSTGDEVVAIEIVEKDDDILRGVYVCYPASHNVYYGSPNILLLLFACDRFFGPGKGCCSGVVAGGLLLPH